MRRITLFLIAGLALALAVAGCSRGQPRETRPLVIIPDMEFQPKWKAQGTSSFFEDGRMMRTPPVGTVARGSLKSDSTFFAGSVDGQVVVHNPLPVTAELMERGRDRYNIYCVVCHDQTGSGKGIITEYQGFVPPATFHDERALAFTDGHLFKVISNGIRNMPGYAAQIPTADRWAIVAYVRALQRSQNATLADVPADKRKDLN